MEYQRLLWQLGLTLQSAALCVSFEGGSEVTLPSNSFYGPITLSINNRQGDICSFGFDDRAARVVCSQLEYSGGNAVISYRPESPVTFAKDPFQYFVMTEQYFMIPRRGQLSTHASNN